MGKIKVSLFCTKCSRSWIALMFEYAVEEFEGHRHRPSAWAWCPDGCGDWSREGTCHLSRTADDMLIDVETDHVMPGVYRWLRVPP